MENSEIVVSIICNTFNHEKFIIDCLDGFICQKTSFKFEVLIHDDASTDDTQKIIKQYEEKYPEIIKPIYQKVNQYSKGINNWVVHQFPRAKGKYIALCEGDDYWTDPLKLQKQVNTMNEHPECSYCFHKSHILNETNKTLLEIENKNKKTILDVHNFRAAVLVTTSSVLIRNYTDQKYLDPLINLKHTHGDFLLYCSLLTFGKVAFIDEFMSVYRKHIGGICFDQYSEAYLRNRIVELRIEEKYFQNKKIVNEIRKIIVNRAVLYLNKYLNSDLNNESFCLQIKRDLKGKPYYYLHICNLFVNKVIGKTKKVFNRTADRF